MENMQRIKHKKDCTRMGHEGILLSSMSAGSRCPLPHIPDQLEIFCVFDYQSTSANSYTGNELTQQLIYRNIVRLIGGFYNNIYLPSLELLSDPFQLLRFRSFSDNSGQPRPFRDRKIILKRPFGCRLFLFFFRSA